MGKGKAWEDKELVNMAKAWISASEDGATGNQQKGSVFWDKIFEKFKELCGNNS
jgi:hypothetical protein